MTAVDAGRYDRQVLIQQATEVQDSTGYAVKTWANLATVWAQIIPVVGMRGGKETYQADKVYADLFTVFRIRYRADITNKMRIVYQGDNYDIQQIKEYGRREALEITAKAEVL